MSDVMRDELTAVLAPIVRDGSVCGARGRTPPQPSPCAGREPGSGISGASSSLPAHGEGWGKVPSVTAPAITPHANPIALEPNPARRESTEIDTLARAYRAGEQGVLAELHAALRPIIQSSVARAFQLG